MRRLRSHFGGAMMVSVKDEPEQGFTTVQYAVSMTEAWGEKTIVPCSSPAAAQWMAKVHESRRAEVVTREVTYGPWRVQQ